MVTSRQNHSDTHRASPEVRPCLLKTYGIHKTIERTLIESTLHHFRSPAQGDFVWAENTQIWISGYGSIDLHLKNGGNTHKITLHDFALQISLTVFPITATIRNLVENRNDPTTLRRPDGTIIQSAAEIHGQWVLEPSPAPQKSTATIWHKRLGHPGPAAIEHLVQQTEGVRIKGITTVHCNACGEAKAGRQIRRTPRINDEAPGERLAIDFHSYEPDSIAQEKGQTLMS
ncbi:hypothetical protein E4U26_003818 [Claviceps purpurea]|nr:hypothetical protein E4U26_003818 [Claviceps purpurea]